MLFRKKWILAVAESAYGTDPTPVDTNAILTKNCAINPQQGNRVTRDLDRPTLGNDKEIATSRYTTVTFEVELAGAGAAGDVPAYGVLLRGCGLSETVAAGVSVTYEPVSDGFESLTLYYYHENELHKLTGARGTVRFTLSADQLPMMAFTFTGLHNDPATATPIAPDNSAFVDPIAVTKVNTPTFTVDSYAVKAEEFTLDLANNVTYRNVVNSETVEITDRAPAGTVAFEQVPIATKNFWAIAKAETLVALNIVHGTTAGNIVQITAGRVQLSQPSQRDSDGIAVMSLNTRFIPTDSGDDELSIVVK